MKDPQKTHWAFVLAVAILGIAALASLCFGITMLALVHTELKRGGERWGLLLVQGFSEVGLPIMGVLLVAAILFALRAKRPLRPLLWAATILTGAGIVADAGAVGWISMTRHREKQQLPFYTSGLRDALEAGDVQRVKQIIDSGQAEWEDNDGEGNSALSIAAKRGDKAMVEAMLAHVSNDASDLLSLQCAEGRSPLHWAVLSGNIDVVKLLLDRGVRVNDEDTSHKTPLVYAEESGNKPMAKLLRERGATPVDYERQITLAVRDRDVARVEAILAKGARMDGLPLLQIAAEQGDLAMAEVLLRKGQKAGQKSRDGTPLHFAAKAGQVEMIRLLISKGADPNASSETLLMPLPSGGGEVSHDTPLCWAVVNGQTESVRALLDNCADPKAGRVWEKESYIQAATRLNHPEIVELLHKHGAKE